MTTFDAREYLLTRLQTVLKTISPGVVFTFPDGTLSRPCVSDLGGRVYSKIRTQSRTAEEEMPFVELVTSSKMPDTVTPLDSDMYAADLKVELWGYVKADDQGDGFDTVVREKLNLLRGDLIIAVEAFPYWTSNPGFVFDSPRSVLGPIEPVLTSQWTEPAMDTPDGFLTLEFSIRYLFNRKNP
jgi:hypothetical protein